MSKQYQLCRVQVRPRPAAITTLPFLPLPPPQAGLRVSSWWPLGPLDTLSWACPLCPVEQKGGERSWARAHLLHQMSSVEPTEGSCHVQGPEDSLLLGEFDARPQGLGLWPKPPLLTSPAPGARWDNACHQVSCPHL